MSGRHALGVLGLWDREMAITRIPDRYQLGLSKIKQLSNEMVDSLVRVLSTAPRTSKYSVLKSHVLLNIKGIEPDDIEEIVLSLYSLYLARTDEEMPVGKYVSQLSRAMCASGRKDLIVSPEEKPSFDEKLIKLLSIDPVLIISKSDILKREFERTFCDARIISDVRPVFSKPEERPITALVTHSLKIEFHGPEGRHDEFYIVLDDDDLAKLKKLIERATVKSASLKALLRESGTPEIDVS
jgi:hypothetical protein